MHSIVAISISLIFAMCQTSLGEEVDKKPNILRNVDLVETLEALAKKAGRQFTVEPKLAGAKIELKGHLLGEASIQQIEDIAFIHELQLEDDGQNISVGPAQKVAAEAKPKDEFPPIFIGPKDKEGITLKEAWLNDMFQFYAISLGLQYIHNPAISGWPYAASGHIKEDDSLKVFNALADHFGLIVHQRKHTIYALTKAQSERLLKD